MSPLLTPLWCGERTYARVASELRRFTEQYLKTGQAPVVTP